MKIKNICFMNLSGNWEPEDGLRDEIYKNFSPEEYDIRFYGSTAVGADRRNIFVRGNLDEDALIRAQKIASKYRKTVAVPNIEVATVDSYDPYGNWLGKENIVHLPGQEPYKWVDKPD